MRHAHITPTRHHAAGFSDGAFVAAVLMAVALTVLTAIGARTWLDRPFAGFFVRADRTVAAVGRAAWSGVAGTRLYDRTLVAIDGIAIAGSDDFHRRIAAKPVGSPFAYTLTDGTATDTVTIPSRRFSTLDYWTVFGAYLTTGLCYVLLAILAAWALPARRLGRALLFLGGAGGIFMLSSADLYPPGSSLRVHALAAVLLPAALLQFALVVGQARGRFAAIAQPVAWSVSLAAAAAMQLLIGDPAATRWVSATCDTALGLAFAAATIGLLAARIRVGVQAAPLVSGTALFGLAVPAVIFLLAGVRDGVPLNASATIAFLFPLGTSIALLRDTPAIQALDVAPSKRSL
jgi:hypothetical protein